MLQLEGWADRGRDIQLYYCNTETNEVSTKTFTLKDGISVDDVTRMSYDYRDRQMTEKLKSFHKYIKEDLCLKRVI